jgi:hypothetical protein
MKLDGVGGSGVIALDVDDNNKRQYLLLDEVERPMISKLLHVNDARRKPRRIRTLDGGVGHAFRQDLGAGRFHFS